MHIMEAAVILQELILQQKRNGKKMKNKYSLVAQMQLRYSKN
jgi:hypothetical protein